jgi:hypothetical protein
MEWQVFGTLEPFSAERADARTGTIVMMLANVHRKKGSRPWTLAQCTPMFGDTEAPKKRAMSWQAMKTIGKAMTEESRVSHKKPKQRKRGS